MKVCEGMLDVPDGRVWYRSVGEGGVPLLCLHGGPGMTHNYIDPLEDLGERRRVIFYDQLGCGRSDRPDDTSLWTVPFTSCARRGRCAGLSSSTGSPCSAARGVASSPCSTSSTISRRRSSACSCRAARRACRAGSWGGTVAPGRAALDDVRRVIEEHEAAGFTSCPEYLGAVAVFYQRHLCRLQPWPAGLERSFAEMSPVVYETMNGPSEFTVTGRFRDWDVFDRLGEIRVPALVMGGRHDEIRVDHLTGHSGGHRSVPSSSSSRRVRTRRSTRNAPSSWKR